MPLSSLQLHHPIQITLAFPWDCSKNHPNEPKIFPDSTWILIFLSYCDFAARMTVSYTCLISWLLGLTLHLKLSLAHLSKGLHGMLSLHFLLTSLHSPLHTPPQATGFFQFLKCLPIITFPQLFTSSREPSLNTPSLLSDEHLEHWHHTVVLIADSTCIFIWVVSSSAY